MASNGDEITVGYWYYMSFHLMLGHRVDKFTKIRFGDKVGWTGEVTETGQIHINKPNLFGGEQRQGGIVGYFDLIMGSDTEEVNSYLYSVVPDPDPMPAFRGRASIVGKDVAISANDPYLRPINVECFRQPAKDWYPEVEAIGELGDVNPAHIIWELLTSTEWGLGYSILDIDDTSFRAAANTLYNERFGLSFLWKGEETLEEFIMEVIRHIEGALFVDPSTGQFVLKLIRDDYDINAIPVFSESNVISVDTFERLSPSELINQVTVLWYDRVKDKKRPVTVHSTPVQELQGGIVAQTVEFAGIPDADLAMKVATRELKKHSACASRVVIRTNRAGALLRPGDVFILHWPDLEIDQVVYRVGRVEFGGMEDIHVRIHAVEDIFGFGSSLYAPPPNTAWEDPIHEPAPAPLHQMMEVPYITVERTASELESVIDSLDNMAGFVAYQATKPTLDAFNYSLYTRASGGSYSYRNRGRFTPTAVLAEQAVREVTSVWGIQDVQLISSIQVGRYALIGSELVEVTAIAADSVSVKRGILDTVPSLHAPGAVIWFLEQAQVVDFTQWASGVTVNGKALTLTGKGELDISLAPEDSITIARRWYRPYPPGKFQVNGLYWPVTELAGELVFTWAERNRLTQLSYYVAQSESSVPAEAGTTYTIRVYGYDGTLLRTVTGLTGTTWTYTSAMEIEDGSEAVFKVTIAAVRGGLESYQAQTIVVLRNAVGWGYNWGNYWGGPADL